MYSSQPSQEQKILIDSVNRLRLQAFQLVGETFLVKFFKDVAALIDPEGF
jgi:hypothetical protein